MKIKNKKILEFLCFLLIIISFIVMGYYTYKSYNTQKQDNNEEPLIDNYYSVEYLFNSDYIKNANNITDFSNDKDNVYMYLDKENTLYIKYTNEKNKYNKKVTGITSKATVFYNNLNDDIYELSALTKDGELFYTKINLSNKKDYTFKKIASNINSIYSPTYDKKYVYVNNNKGFKTNFIYLDNNNNLMYLDKDKDYVLKDNLSDVKPYFNYICASNNTSLCNNIMIYQDFENKLITKYNNKIIKNENNKEIIVKDLFAVLSVKEEKEIDLSNISYSKLKKYNYLFTTYIVDENNNIYILEIDKNTINNKEDISAKLYNSNKVKQLKYEGNIAKINIIYANGTSEEIKKDKNKTIVSSTVYDRLENKKLT